jgi:hypothetical protein
MLAARLLCRGFVEKLQTISNLKRQNPEAGTPRHFQRLALEIELPAV